MKKWSLAHFCGYLSLAISITLLVLWCCNVGGFTVVSLDSFVGVIVALLAIVVTIAIGWQIFNVVDINDKIKKLYILEEKFNKQEKTINQQTKETKHLIMLIYGIEANKEGHSIEAFRYLMASLVCSMLLDKPINAENILNKMKSITNQIKNESVYNHSRIKEIQEYDKKIKASPCYDIIKSRYEDIYKEFNSKVKVGND